MKHKIKVLPQDRKWRGDRANITRCPCGRPAVTNSASGCAACIDCLKIEKSFADAETTRARIESKFSHGLGKYFTWYTNIRAKAHV